MTGSQKGMLAAFSGNFIFGLSFLFSKKAFSAVESVLLSTNAEGASDIAVVLAIRFIFAFLLMTAALPLLKIKISFKGKPVWKLVLLGIFQPVIYFVCESYGLKMTGIVVSSVLIALVPIVCQLLSALILKEAPSFLQVVFCTLSVAGVSLVTLFSENSGNTYIAGIIFLVVAVISAAAFNIVSRNTAQIFTPFERTYFMFIVSSVFFLVYALISLKGDASLLIKPLTEPDFIVSILYLGGLSSVCAYLLINYSNTYLPLTRSTVFSNVITVVSTAAGFFVGETFNLPTVFGAVIIIFGVWGVQRFSKND